MSLDNEILACAKNYLLGDKSIYNKESSLFQKLFDAYISDVNSSTLREAVTLSLLDYIKLDKKHGADGRNPVTNKLVEVKPQFSYLRDNGKQSKFSGGGSFNDITFAKIEGCRDWDLVCSGFAQDKLLYVVRFPFEFLYPYLKSSIENKILKNKTVKEGETQGRFSFGFRYSHYIDCPDLEILIFDKTNAQNYMCKPMYKKFCERVNDSKLLKYKV